MISLHRRCLNARLRQLLPFERPSLEIGNGANRRGIDLGADATLDLDPQRRPTYVADAHGTGLRSASYYTVVCCETLQYVRDPLAVLKECRRLLQSSGFLVLSVPSRRRGPITEFRWRYEEIVGLVTEARFRVFDCWPVLGVRSYASGFVLRAQAIV